MCHVTLLLCFMYWCLFLAKINLGPQLANFHQRNVVSVVVVVNSNLFYHHPLFLALSLFKFYTYLYLLHSNQEWYCVKWSKGKTIILNVTILNRSVNFLLLLYKIHLDLKEIARHMITSFLLNISVLSPK